MKPKIQFDIITIFPHCLDSYAKESILRIAQKKGLIKINFHDLRDYTVDKHRTVDDKPYGGGPGMVMMAEPLHKAIKKMSSLDKKIREKRKEKIILLSPTGKTFDQKKAQGLAELKRIVFICGRYEGIDARVEKFIDEKISIGNYVLSGGELPAMVIAESVTRLIPGVLGRYESVKEESFSDGQNSEYPQYTRPEKFLKWPAPKILLSGNHQKIADWRKNKQKKKPR
ncbi:MAG: tRNA (guanosine(37)-N1)-methyltransferase TrmD [Patescibacteria group bacterium]|nr:tRNA (guanosine(37)-N1)-methyltransferase TrmD [Patescibacteria group bacterium]MDD5490884.1 tRNA (guanosine(37)-N1)-methyltransferase TrmD [Patescibacteria group bacterium]